MALSTTTTAPTGWAANAAHNNFLRAQQIADQPYQAYPGPLQAGWNQGQQSGYDAIMNGGQIGQPAMQQAQTAALSAAQAAPQQVQARGYDPAMQGVMNTPWASAGAAHLGQAFGTRAEQAALAQMQAAQMARSDVRDVAAKNFLNYDVNAYMNPYIGAVVNNSLADLSRQNDIVNNQTNARAQAAGAFGGSRQAVANSLNNENYLRESGNLSGKLRHQGYDTASGLIMQDATRDLTAQGMNQTMDWNVGNLNTNMSQQAGLQNMLASNAMSQYNAGNRQSANSETAAARNARETANMNAINNMTQYNASNQQAAHRDTSAAHNTALANQASARNRAAEFGSDLDLRGQLANQAAYQNNINSRIQAANALNGMGMDEQTRAFNAARAQFEMGQARTGFDQQSLDNAYNQWAAGQNYPMRQLGILQQGLNGYSSGETKTTPYYNNTAANVLAGGIGAGQLLANAPSMIKGATSLWNSLPDIPGFGFGL